MTNIRHNICLIKLGNVVSRIITYAKIEWYYDDNIRLEIIKALQYAKNKF